jgi:hypothetical protein
MPLATIVVIGSVALYAPQVTSTSTRHVMHTPYTTTEVLEFLLFSTGRVVADHPDFDKQREPMSLEFHSRSTGTA